MTRGQFGAVMIGIAFLTIMSGIGARWWWVRTKVQTVVQTFPSSQPIGESQPTPLSEPFQLQPPSNSLIGTIKSATPITSKLSRDDKDWRPVELPDTIVDGDRLLATGSAVAVVTFSQFGQVQLNEDADISFSSTLPESFLVRQAKGDARYMVEERRALSIRALHALIVLQSGEATLSIDAESSVMELVVSEGKAQIGIIGADNQTRTWSVASEQSATINDAKRQVTIK